MLLFVKANQSLVFSDEATQQLEDKNAPALGRPACAAVPQVLNTGRAVFRLGCCGARAYLDILTDDAALFAIPGAKLDAYSERIEVLAKASHVLVSFHKIRGRDVENGKTLTVHQSLAALGA